MNQPKKSRAAGMGDYLTSTISVMLVLFILGLVAVVQVAFDGAERQIKERVGFTVVLADSVPTPVVEALQKRAKAAPYASSWQYYSADEVLRQQAGDEAPELVRLLGANPYAPMMDVRVRSPWAVPDSLESLMAAWAHLDGVDEVSANTELAGSLDHNTAMLNTVLLVIAAALLLISFVLINNTVRLTVYSRRFLIHTMRLVGARGSFIRRPFLRSSLLQGLVAALVAAGLLAAFIGWVRDWDPEVGSFVGWGTWGIIAGAMVLAGLMICAAAAVLATNRYLRASYDDMF